ncbi:TetR/AcrR family transcriptional regulator [Pseudoalteromonas sp. SSDWG2]|uniref:TetR/AcrR family transcriptional regulator n=1 Tax=Pseudoalteromonas sp. SSDWG2 TaxID=3139391 RepID=UPI003BAD20D2
MRSTEFDRSEVLHNAMQTFMEHGYAKSSMQKLTSATGLHPGSIYCAFGSKKGLFVEAINYYQTQKRKEFMALFDDKTPVLNSLKALIDSVVAQCLDDSCAKVCLLTQSLNEMGNHDPQIKAMLSENLQHIEQQLALHIMNAQKQGEGIRDDCPLTLARFVSLGLYGLRTYAYTHQDKAILKAMGDQLLLSIKS